MSVYYGSQWFLLILAQAACVRHACLHAPCVAWPLLSPTFVFSLSFFLFFYGKKDTNFGRFFCFLRPAFGHGRLEYSVCFYTLYRGKYYKWSVCLCFCFLSHLFSFVIFCEMKTNKVCLQSTDNKAVLHRCCPVGCVGFNFFLCFLWLPFYFLEGYIIRCSGWFRGNRNEF